jgi:hypothetical protein
MRGACVESGVAALKRWFMVAPLEFEFLELDCMTEWEKDSRLRLIFSRLFIIFLIVFIAFLLRIFFLTK